MGLPEMGASSPFLSLSFSFPVFRVAVSLDFAANSNALQWAPSNGVDSHVTTLTYASANDQ